MGRAFGGVKVKGARKEDTPEKEKKNILKKRKGRKEENVKEKKEEMGRRKNGQRECDIYRENKTKN